MTGLECLKEEMMRRGCTKSQAESKTALIVLEILAQDTEHIYTDLQEARQELERVKRSREQEEMEVRDARRRLSNIQKELNTATAGLTDLGVKALKYLEDFEKRLMECETAEQRDALRTAQFFVNNARIETNQNNTAFIYGLGLILAGHAVTGEKLEPVNIDGSMAYPKRIRDEFPHL